MEDATGVQIDKGLENLIEKTLHLLRWHLSGPRLQVLLEVELEILEDQIKRFLAV